MHDDMVTTRWKHLTDKVKSLWTHPAEDAGAKGSQKPTVPAAMPRADREDDRQAAPLAAWEDEGGRTSRSAEAPLRNV